MVNLPYYVYEWYFVDTGKVFYVGKGKDRRYLEKKDRNQMFKNYVKKFHCMSRKLLEGLTEEEAYAKEIEIIESYLSSGITLCNKTKGGEDPPTFYGTDSRNHRSVVQLTLDGKFIHKWLFIREAEESLGISNTLISKSCKRKGKEGHPAAGGFLWVYEDEYHENHIYRYKCGTVAKPVLQYQLDGIFIREWENAKQAANELGLFRGPLCSCLKGNYYSCGGYLWKYKSGDTFPKRITPLSDIRKRTRTSGIPTPVIQLDKDSNFIAKYKNCADAAKAIGVKSNTSILRNCKHERASAHGYRWTFEYEYEALTGSGK